MNEILARRYAAAYFALAEEAKQLDAWRQHLQTAVEVFAHPEVATAMANPRTTVSERVDLAMHLLDAVSAPARNLCRLLLERGRIGLLAEVLQQYDALAAAKSGRLAVTIEVATELGNDAKEDVVSRLQKELHREIDAEVKVVPDLVGGLVIHIGDRIIDNSVRSKLQQLAVRLAA